MTGMHADELVVDAETVRRLVAELFGARPTPGIGFALGIDRVAAQPVREAFGDDGPLRHAREQKARVNFIFKDIRGEFLKRAEGDVLFEDTALYRRVKRLNACGWRSPAKTIASSPCPSACRSHDA